MAIRFFYEDTHFKIKKPKKTKEWLITASKKEKRNIKELNYIFCNDSFLLEINTNFLKHKTLTDIITFDYSVKKFISGEIYISVDRVEENSSKFICSFDEEILRVMIHGVLHLLGYKDNTKRDSALMRKKEEAYLSLWRKSST